MIKAKQKEPSDSIFTLDDLIQKSIEMNNFLKQKISSTSPNYQSLTNFFSQKIKLHNSFKKNFWERNTSQENVIIYFITYLDL